MHRCIESVRERRSGATCRGALWGSDLEPKRKPRRAQRQQRETNVKQCKMRSSSEVSELVFPYRFLSLFHLFTFFSSNISTTFFTFHPFNMRKIQSFSPSQCCTDTYRALGNVISVTEHQYCDYESSWLQGKNYCKASNRKRSRSITWTHEQLNGSANTHTIVGGIRWHWLCCRFLFRINLQRSQRIHISHDSKASLNRQVKLSIATRRIEAWEGAEDGVLEVRLFCLGAWH